MELLATAQDDGEPNLTQFVLPLPRMEALGAERAQPGESSDDSYMEKFDVVIMNPPFTRNDIRNRQYTASDRKRIQDREKEVVNFVRKRQGSLGVTSAGEAINHTSIETFFTPLADILLKSTDAVFAQVIPTTALTGSSAKVKRIFLAERFQIETIITSHDPSRVSFSENTDIHESLFIARRSDAEKKPTRFISLGRMPGDAHEAMLLADMINQGKISTEWGREHEWRWERMREGDWQAALFYDGELAEAYYDLAALNGTRLQIADNTCKIEPAGRRVRDAFSRNSKLDTPWKTPVLWDHQTDVRTTMAAKPDVVATPKRGREKYAQSLVKKASRLVISERLYTYAVRTAACYTKEPVLGSAWMPVTSLSTTPHFDQALCAWWNSTPGILTMLHARSKKLTYPTYSLDLLRKLLIPNPRNVDVSPLIDVFAKTHQQVLKPWKEMDTCPVRARIDEAAAQILHIDGTKIADWRKRITLEPTVSNRPAVARFG